MNSRTKLTKFEIPILLQLTNRSLFKEFFVGVSLLLFLNFFRAWQFESMYIALAVNE